MNITIDGHGLDIVNPTISRPNKADIKAGFKFHVLTAIKGKPTYNKMKEIVHQLVRNVLTIKASFGDRPRDRRRRISERNTPQKVGT